MSDKQRSPMHEAWSRAKSAIPEGSNRAAFREGFMAGLAHARHAARLFEAVRINLRMNGTWESEDAPAGMEKMGKHESRDYLVVPIPEDTP